MKEISIRLLSKGDSLYQFEENRLVIKKKNGEYWIYHLIPDPSDGFPTINKDLLVKIVSGKTGTVEIFDSETKITIRR